MQELATLADLSVSQLERHCRRVFQLTPQQLLGKVRIEAAMRELAGDANIALIGAACGFADQSAFARRFKATVGMTPRDYRAHAQSRLSGSPPPPLNGAGSAVA
jgi:AraC-like DNA-binding protein